MADYLQPGSNPAFSDQLRAVTTDDPAHPDTWNPQFLALLENDAFLQSALSKTRGDVEEILGSDPINLSDRLDALIEYGAQSVYVERAAQVPSVAIESAVGGDDSIDLASTDGIKPGQHYFVVDSGNAQAVRVRQVLSGNRVTIYGKLKSTVAAGAELSRISPNGYVTPQLDDMERGAHLHAQGEDLTAQYWGGSDWQKLTRRSNGSWDIPSNVTRVRVDGTVERVAVISSLPIGVTRRPKNVSPAASATGITATPTLTGEPYYPLYGVPQELRRFYAFRPGADEPFYTADETPSSGDTVVKHTVADPIDVDADHEWQYQDKNVEGEWAQRSPRTAFSTAATYVDTPSVTSPTDGATDVPEQPVVELSAFSVVSGSDVHDSASLRIKDDTGEVVWKKTQSSGDLTRFVIPAGLLQPGKREYTLEPQYHGETYGSSAWGNPSSITTAASFIPDFESEIGTPFGGGYVAGKYVSDYDGETYGLIVSDGGGDSEQMGDGRLKWRDSKTQVSGTDGVPPKTLADGRANHNAILALNDLASFPAFKWIEDNCNAGDGLNGHTDWCLPSRDELEMAFRVYKPSTTDNNDGTRSSSGYGGDGATHGTNNSSDPNGSGYTPADPAQTSFESFKEGGADAVTTSSNYWSSTENGSSSAWVQSFDNGHQDYHYKTGPRYVRAVRRIKL